MSEFRYWMERIDRRLRRLERRPLAAGGDGESPDPSNADPSEIAATPSPGTADSYSRSDHVHSGNSGDHSHAQYPTLGSAPALSVGDANSAGNDAEAARRDHVHEGAALDHTHAGTGDHTHDEYATDADLTAHTAAGDPHPGYATDADLTAHAAAADPHTAYQKEAEKGTPSGYASLDATTKVPIAQVPTGTTASTVSLGNHAHTPFTVAADAAPPSVAGASAVGVSTDYAREDHTHAGATAADISTHAAAADPHTGYQKESEKAVASGYASLDATTKVPIAQVPTGTTSTTVSLGNHTHAATVLPADAAPPSVGAASVLGTSSDYAREDHTHAGATAADIAAHVAASDPHTGYATDADLTAHNAAADPHTGYQKESEKAAASGYASLDATTKVPIAQVPTGTTSATVALGNHTHTPFTVAADTAPPSVGAASVLGVSTDYAREDHTHAGATAADLAAHAAAGDPHPGYATDTDLTNHAAAADPHTGYQRESEKAAASGYASLDATTKVPIAQVPTGTSGTTVALGNHAHTPFTVAADAAPPGVAAASAIGVSTDYAREDHTHAGATAADLANHAAAADPHPNYVTPSEIPDEVWISTTQPGTPSELWVDTDASPTPGALTVTDLTITGESPNPGDVWTAGDTGGQGSWQPPGALIADVVSDPVLINWFGVDAEERPWVRTSGTPVLDWTPEVTAPVVPGAATITGPGAMTAEWQGALPLPYSADDMYRIRVVARAIGGTATLSVGMRLYDQNRTLLAADAECYPIREVAVPLDWSYDSGWVGFISAKVAEGSIPVQPIVGEVSPFTAPATPASGTRYWRPVFTVTNSTATEVQIDAIEIHRLVRDVAVPGGVQASYVAAERGDFTEVSAETLLVPPGVPGTIMTALDSESVLGLAAPPPNAFFMADGVAPDPPAWGFRLGDLLIDPAEPSLIPQVGVFNNGSTNHSLTVGTGYVDIPSFGQVEFQAEVPGLLRVDLTCFMATVASSTSRITLDHTGSTAPLTVYNTGYGYYSTNASMNGTVSIAITEQYSVSGPGKVVLQPIGSSTIAGGSISYVTMFYTFYPYAQLKYVTG